MQPVLAASTGDLQGNAIRRRNLRLYLGEMESHRSAHAADRRSGQLSRRPTDRDRVRQRERDARRRRHRSGRILGADRGYRKATPGPKLSTEASATMVWETIRDMRSAAAALERLPVPPVRSRQPRLQPRADCRRAADRRDASSNGCCSLFAFEQIVAIGNHASLSLQRHGHRAHQRCATPRKAARTCSSQEWRNCRRLERGMKKSQIQQIKEGRAMRERTWSGRLQPLGPMVQLKTKNAVEPLDRAGELEGEVQRRERVGALIARAAPHPNPLPAR